MYISQFRDLRVVGIWYICSHVGVSLKDRFLEPAGSEDKCIGEILLACLRNKEQQCLIPPLL